MTMTRLRHAVWLAAALACGPLDQGGSGPLDNGGGSTGGGSDGGAAPSIVIVSPQDGATCEADEHDGTCPVVVTVSGAVLAPRGKCGGSRGTCGHVELFVDGTACGSPNHESGSSALVAEFGRCNKLDGTHTVACELRDDGERTLARSRSITLQVQRHGHGDDDDDDD